MGVFKEMDPAVARRAVEGYQDELSPEREEKKSFYSNFSCPRCKCELQEDYDPRTAFTGDNLVAKAILNCGNCGYCIDPHTNIVVECGSAAKIPVEVLPIIGGKYIPD